MDTYTGNGFTLLDIQDEVCRRCFKDTGTFRSLITAWVNEAQQKIATIANGRWWWLEKSVEVPVSSGDDEIDLPADFFEPIDNASVRDATCNVILTPMNHAEFQRRNLSESPQTGRPNRYCIFAHNDTACARKLKFKPSSDTPRTIVIDYYKILPILAGDNDTPQIPYWYQHLLIEFAVMRGQEYRQMPEQATLARNNWIDGLQQLMVEADTNNHLQGALRPKWRW
ncbi:MAG: hypothetical protein RBU23_12630 [Candidatus Auribacterota bacterium]|jgi:hypothetical protein|nr:hypothetical protein [Candidatus Auribacterota bacterium]